MGADWDYSATLIGRTLDMADADRSRTVRFGLFEVDLRAGELRKNGAKIKLQEQPLKILVSLLRQPGEVVTREELRSELWPADTFVDFDHGLNAAVKRLRDALDDSAGNPRFIETLPRHGYRFIGAMSLGAVQTERRQSPVRQPVVLFVSALFAVIAAVTFIVYAGSVRGKLTLRFAAQPQIHSLAVLPLTNFSGDPKQEYFADAMTDELIGELSRIDSLKIISRTSVMQYKGEKRKSLPQIASELGVDGVIEGSVLHSGDRVRIAAQLVYAPTDQHLWSAAYERDLGDVLNLQAEVAEAIAQQIRLKLTPEQLKRLHQARPVDPEAFEDYMTAGNFVRLSNELEGIKKAQIYLRKAIQKDPDFVAAHMTLADTYFNLGELRWLAPRDAFEPAKQSALRALALDESRCDAHGLLAALSLRYHWDWQTAEKELNHAMRLCPGDARARWHHAYYLAWTGRGEEALAEIERTREIDPFKEYFLRVKAAIYQCLRNYNGLVEVSRTLVATNPNDWVGHTFLGIGYQGSSQLRQAIAEYEKAVELSPLEQDSAAALAHAYATAGRRKKAKEIAGELQRRSRTTYVSSYMIAAIYAGLADKNQAFEFLEKAYQERSSDLPYFLRTDLRVDTLRPDPRFQDLMRRMNFPR
jgi:TolB-like protein/DNA-binding winged helix-turn-helix (wHTH) protein/Flp pilus assembly protein TadD